MLVFQGDLSRLNLALDVHEFVEDVEHVGEGGVVSGGQLLTEFEASLLDWSNVQQVVHDPSKNVINLLLILVLSGNDNLLVEVVDTDDVANECLQGRLEPVDPGAIELQLDDHVVVHVHTRHVAVQVGHCELIADQSGIVSQEIVSVCREVFAVRVLVR